MMWTARSKGLSLLKGLCSRRFFSRVPPQEQTIFGLATGNHMQRTAVAIVRLSGSNLLSLVDRLLRTSEHKEESTDHALQLKARKATLCTVQDPLTKEPIDRALALFFPAPHSYTGEDVVELHIHGGRSCIKDTLSALSTLPNCRPALPGEFTRRAFENGKMDLTEVEGLDDLLQASTSKQRTLALRQLSGSIKSTVQGWINTLLNISASVEVVLDFGEDADIDDQVALNATQAISKLIVDIESQIKNAKRGERLRDGITISLFGPPNAGKSSLLNILAQRPAAIVSPIAGTTRDVVEVAMDLCGFPAIICDTAGLRNSVDPIEEIGIERAHNVTKDSDLKICVLDVTNFPECIEEGESSSYLKSLIDEDTVIVLNKLDLHPSPPSYNLSKLSIKPKAIVQISCNNNTGIDSLLNIVSNHLSTTYDQCDEESSVLFTRERHKQELEQAVGALNRCLKSAESRQFEIMAEELRCASKSLGRITGHIDVEQMLDVLFRDFCIGK